MQINCDTVYNTMDAINKRFHCLLNMIDENKINTPTDSIRPATYVAPYKLDVTRYGICQNRCDTGLYRTPTDQIHCTLVGY